MSFGSSVRTKKEIYLKDKALQKIGYTTRKGADNGIVFVGDVAERVDVAIDQLAILQHQQVHISRRQFVRQSIKLSTKKLPEYVQQQQPGEEFLPIPKQQQQLQSTAAARS